MASTLSVGVYRAWQMLGDDRAVKFYLDPYHVERNQSGYFDKRFGS